MSGSGSVKVKTEEDDIEEVKRLEDNELLKLIFGELKKISEYLSMISGEENVD